MRTLQISAEHSFPVEAMAKLLTRCAILLCDVLLWPWAMAIKILRFKKERNFDGGKASA